MIRNSMVTFLTTIKLILIKLSMQIKSNVDYIPNLLNFMTYNKYLQFPRVLTKNENYLGIPLSIFQNLTQIPKTYNEFCPKKGAIMDNGSLQDLIKSFLCNYTNSEIIDKFLIHNEKCYEILNNIISGNISNLWNAINWSGKGLNDIGNQNECYGNKLKYFLIELSNNKTYNFVDSNQLYRFLMMKKSLWGLCFFPECESFIFNYFNSAKNTKFLSYLDTIGFTNFTIYSKFMVSANGTKQGKLNYKSLIIEEAKEGDISEVDSVSTIFAFLFYGTFAILIFRICISLVGHLIFDVKDSDTKDVQNEFGSVSKENTIQEFSDKGSTYPIKGFMERMYKYFSINGYFRRITQIKNKYFNDTNLEVLCGAKSCLLFFFTFLQLNDAISNLPRRNSGNYYYTNFSFFIVKFSSYSLESIVCINGIICGFKLMNIFKKEKEIKFSTVWRFIVNSLSKVIVFNYIFFLFYYFMGDIGTTFGFNYMTEFFMTNYVNNNLCIQKYLSSIIPFYYQYVLATGKCELDYEVCFKYFQLLWCEFYCFIFTLLLFYLVSRLQSNKFDSIFTLLVISSTILSYFLYANVGDQTQNWYILQLILGETRIYKQSHILFFVYFVGVNCGIIHFYFKDMVTNVPIQNKDYSPFRYNLKIMKFFYKISGIPKVLFILFLAVVILFLSLSYNIFLLFTSYSRNNNVLIQMNTPLLILYIFEKKIYILAFAGLLLLLLINTKNNLLQSLLTCQIFLIISRLSLCYICLVTSFTYLFYSYNEMQTYLNLVNLFYITFALFFFMIIASLLLMMIYEMPFRMMVKRYFTKTKKEKILTET